MNKDAFFSAILAVANEVSDIVATIKPIADTPEDLIERLRGHGTASSAAMADQLMAMFNQSEVSQSDLETLGQI